MFFRSIFKNFWFFFIRENLFKIFLDLEVFLYFDQNSRILQDFALVWRIFRMMNSYVGIASKKMLKTKI